MALYIGRDGKPTDFNPDPFGAMYDSRQEIKGVQDGGEKVSGYVGLVAWPMLWLSSMLSSWRPPRAW